MSLSIREKLDAGASSDELTAFMEEFTDALTLASKGELLSDFIGVCGYLNNTYYNGSRWIPPEDYQPTTRPWYSAAKDAKGGLGYTSPYIDALTKKTIISASKQLYSTDGKYYGVISTDIDITPISEYVKNIEFVSGGYGLLMNQDLILIAHPDNFNLGRNLKELSPAHAKAAEELASTNKDVFRISLRNNMGQKVISFFRRLYNGWYIGIALSTEYYYQTITRMIVILSLIGVVFMLILSFILLNISYKKTVSDAENKSKSSFLARMSHEIRTPMNSIMGMSDLILRKNLPRELQEYISIIKQSGNTLLAIINDLLDFSKIESGHMQIETKPYYFASLINNIINIIRIRMVGKGVNFFVEIDPAIPTQLLGDEIRIRQILINLLNNAVKYTPKGHINLTVKIKERLPRGRISLSIMVSDTGIGIKPEDQAKLFNEFTRLDEERNQGIEGTGLGLVIANHLCSLMEGSITVESIYGQGSTFTATITQGIVDPQRTAIVERPDRKRVLVYEERQEFARSLVSAMNSLEVSFYCVRDFEEFTVELEKKGYDFAFVSSKYAMECIRIWGKKTISVKLVIMVDLGEVSVFKETGSILMPIYSISLANVLNGLNDDSIEPNDTVSVSRVFNASRFQAPDGKVLIVDDIMTNLRVAQELLALYSIQADTALGGREALEMVKKTRYDIIFMDHMMPGMDGIEATAHIRAMSKEKNDDYYNHVPIVALTANAMSGQREVLLQNRIDDFLAKPIEMQKLEAILEKWLPKEKQIKVNRQIGDRGKDSRVLPEIKGINVEAGILNTGNSLDSYLRILTVFSRDAEERIGQIRDALSQEDRETYAILVHALKSAARSIGARELGDFAAGLENAAEGGEPWNVLQGNSEKFLEQLKALTDAISSVLSTLEDTAAKDKDVTDVSKLHLAALKDALKAMDIETVNTLINDAMSMSLTPAIKELISDLEELVLLADYDKAIEKLDQVL
jgi:signal transduction histidine kinase